MNRSKESLFSTLESPEDRRSRGLEDVVVTLGVVLRREFEVWCEGSAGLDAEPDESFEAIEANGGRQALGKVVKRERAGVLRMNNRG